MPSSTIFHAIVFAAGAALGASAVTLANSRKEHFKPSTTSSKPIFDVGPSGAPVLARHASPDAGDVLKYGNPGEVPL